VIAAAIAVLLVDGGPADFRWSFVLMAVAALIDATDGTLARKLRAKEVLPGFDGRKLDDLVDFLTYVALPLLLIWRAELLPGAMAWWLVIPLVASAYGFCQCAAKTDDGYFLGFPSLWNVVAFYLYVLQLGGAPAVFLIVSLSALTFVPSRYLYPSQPGRLNRVDNLLSLAWTSLIVWLLWRLPEHQVLSTAGAGPGFGAVAWVSLFYPAFYLTASWVVSIKRWLRAPSL
jgi:phosphatidylcholine synthase